MSCAEPSGATSRSCRSCAGGGRRTRRSTRVSARATTRHSSSGEARARTAPTCCTPAAGADVRATLSFTGHDGGGVPVEVPQWSSRPVELRRFDERGDGSLLPAAPGAGRFVLALDPERDLQSADDPYGFSQLFLQRVRVELRLGDGAAGSRSSTSPTSGGSAPCTRGSWSVPSSRTPNARSQRPVWRARVTRTTRGIRCCSSGRTRRPCTCAPSSPTSWTSNGTWPSRPGCCASGSTSSCSRASGSSRPCATSSATCSTRTSAPRSRASASRRSASASTPMPGARCGRCGRSPFRTVACRAPARSRT